jgi:hypothetical protein
MTTFIGRGPGTSPTTDFFPFSAALPSTPVILITGTTAAAANTIHTADAKAYDIPIIYVANTASTSKNCVFANGVYSNHTVYFISFSNIFGHPRSTRHAH